VHYSVVHFNSWEYSFGYSKKTALIFLTNMPTEKKIVKKCRLIDLLADWNKLNYVRRTQILSIFNVTMDDPIFTDKFDAIIFTQPFSEDGACTEEEKIALFRGIVNNNAELKLLIKIHPRDKTNYRLFFPDTPISFSWAPFELFFLVNGKKFKKAITFFSSIAFSNYLFDSIKILGTENYPKLVKRFGIIRGNCEH
jgi:hypothetical protein